MKGGKKNIKEKKNWKRNPRKHEKIKKPDISANKQSDRRQNDGIQDYLTFI